MKQEEVYTQPNDVVRLSPCRILAASYDACLPASVLLPHPSCQLPQQLLQCVHSQLLPGRLLPSSPAAKAVKAANVDHLIPLFAAHAEVQ